MTEKDKITVKYHKHLDGNEPESMVYFTREDVHKCMSEWVEKLVSDGDLVRISQWVAVKNQMPSCD